VRRPSVLAAVVTAPIFQRARLLCGRQAHAKLLHLNNAMPIYHCPSLSVSPLPDGKLRQRLTFHPHRSRVALTTMLVRGAAGLGGRQTLGN
jgi:hypothetical protein